MTPASLFIAVTACLAGVVQVGCGSADIHSVRDPAFKGHISHLLVVVLSPRQSNEGSLLRRALVQELRQRGIDCLGVAMSDLTELESKQAVIERFAADAWLRIWPTQRVHTEAGGLFEVHYDASLIVKREPEWRIWRADVVSWGDWSPESDEVPRALRAAAARIVERLVADGLLHPG